MNGAGLSRSGPLGAAAGQHAAARDAADPLRALRARFAHPVDAQGRPLTYLCGHSLGLMPLEARTRVAEELEDWARLGVLGHEHARRPWIEYEAALRADLAQLAGAGPDEVVAMNSLTVNLHLMLASFYRPQGARTKILIEAGAFSSDRHAVASQIAWHGLDPRQHLIELAPADGSELIDTAHLEETLEREGSRIALVLWPGVQYRTGQAFDLARITAAAQRAGCCVGFDLAHMIGNLPLALHDSEADFAVWCSYKYLNAGPGAIGGAFVHARHAAAQAGKLGTAPLARLTGWWGHDPATRFRMEPQFMAAPGAAGWRLSNPPILATAPLLASLALFREAGMARLRAKSLELTAYLEQLLGHFRPQLAIVTPAAAGDRGCQLSVRVLGGAQRGRAVFDELSARGVVCDWREPDILRIAPVPLYNGFADVLACAQALASALGVPPVSHAS